MNTDEINNTTEAESEPTGRASYCPEDNKLRLYVGRVPRDEYLALRAEGWTSTPKQDCDFVAHWTPTRRDTALKYAGFIEDEDASPADRAADRAERFATYRDKRSDEAHGHADRFDAGPQAHGFQSQARAERAANRHDRIAGRAVDQWDKAEYWQRRTAGVISHALHVSTPSVRMGRIKELETEIRKAEKRRDEYEATRALWLECEAMTDAEKQTARAVLLSGVSSSTYKHPRPEEVKNPYILSNGSSLYGLLTMDGGAYGKPITGAEACAMYLARCGPLLPEGDWLTHYRNRLAYENQMLEAQGGRAGAVEMVAGGWFIGPSRFASRALAGEARRIVKVNKSPTTGRVVSVLVRDNHPSSVNHYGNPFPDGVAQVLSHVIEIERADPDCYRAPTPEELATFKTETEERKAAAKAEKTPCPLINPTDKDAEKLQAIWNAANRSPYKKTPSTVMRCTFAQYEGRGSTRTVCENGTEHRTHYGRNKTRCDVFKVRGVYGENYEAARVVILTDKPQKAIPWDALEAAKAAQPTAATLAPRLPELRALLIDLEGAYRQRTPAECSLLADADYVGLIDTECNRPRWTEAGAAALKAHDAAPKVETQEALNLEA